MALMLAIAFTIVLAAESLWMFALSAHIARVMEYMAPIYLLASLTMLWFSYARAPRAGERRSALRVLVIGFVLMAVGATLGAAAIVSA